MVGGKEEEEEDKEQNISDFREAIGKREKIVLKTAIIFSLYLVLLYTQ